jgi:acetylornithine deacetylase
MIDETLLLELTTGLTAIPSVSGDERAIGAWLAERLERAGARVELQRVLGDRANVLATVDSGHAGPALLFNGHLDTLPVEPAVERPFDVRVEDGWVYGAGVVNMKGAVAALATALIALRGTLTVGRVVLSAVMGECDALGLGTVHALESGLTADACINAEPTELRVLTDHAGVTQLDVTVTGREAHVYEADRGADAIAAAGRVLAALDAAALHGAEGGLERLPALNVGTIAGGRQPSYVAATCRLGIDVRSTGAMTPASIRDDVERLAAEAAGEGFAVEATLRGRPGFVQQSPFRADPSSRVVRAMADAVSAELGRPAEVGPHWPESFYGTDASHIARAGIPTVICGPGSHTQIGRPGERVAVAELQQAARAYVRASGELLERGA